MNAFFTVCQIFYWTGIFPKACEYPEKSKLTENVDKSNLKLNLDCDHSTLPTYTPEKQLTKSEKESIANKYGFSTGYINPISDDYIIYNKDNNNFSENSFINFNF